MTSLSSHALFHYTHTFSALKCILQKGLRFGIIGERIPGNPLIYITRSISLCSIPLSQISEHADWYGHYAIGVKPSFIKKNGGTPVIYVHTSSPYIPHSYGTGNLKMFESSPMTPFLKQICGKQRKYNCVKAFNKNYYDEKEWRIIDKSVPVSVFPYADYTDIKQIVADFKQSAEYSYLVIPLEDIEYILVETKTEIKELVCYLKELKYDSSDIEMILPKVITYYGTMQDI